MLDHHFPQTLNGDFGAYPPSCPILEERRSGLFPRPCCTESWAESQASDVAANEAVAACPSCSFLQLWMTLNYPPVIQHGKSWKSPKQIAGVLEVLFAEKIHRSEWRIFRSSQRASWALASTEVCSGSWITEGPEDTAESKMLCLRQTWEICWRVVAVTTRSSCFRSLLMQKACRRYLSGGGLTRSKLLTTLKCHIVSHEQSCSCSYADQSNNRQRYMI